MKDIVALQGEQFVGDVLGQRFVAGYGKKRGDVPSRMHPSLASSVATGCPSDYTAPDRATREEAPLSGPTFL